MKLLLFGLLVLSFGCSNYVNRLHAEIDAEDQTNTNYKFGEHGEGKFNMYRQQQPMRQSFDQKQVISKSSALYSTRNNLNVAPPVKREYREAKKRVTNEDILDNSTEGSLWSSNGQENFLFSRNNFKRQGDIVVMNVNEKLKNDITLELQRAFPERKKKKDEDKKDENAEQAPEDAAAAPGGDQPEQKTQDGVYDKISSVVIEEVSRDHILIRGRKDVLYQRQKRLVEIQALVARRNVKDDDTVESQNFLEHSVAVLR